MVTKEEPSAGVRVRNQGKSEQKPLQTQFSPKNISFALLSDDLALKKHKIAEISHCCLSSILV